MWCAELSRIHELGPSECQRACAYCCVRATFTTGCKYTVVSLAFLSFYQASPVTGRAANFKCNHYEQQQQQQDPRAGTGVK